MNVTKNLQQYGVLIVGLLIGGGFAFGGIASYSGMVNTGGSQDSQQSQGPTLPEGNILDRPSNLSFREKAYLGYTKDVVFVTVLEGEKEVQLDRQSIVSTFSQRVYFYTVEGNSTALASRVGVTEFPKAVAVSGTVSNRRLSSSVRVVEPTQSAITSAVCGVMRDWGNAAATCVSR
ncbi:MAG: hypothetical protein ABEJ66_02435 [Candidatus Nanohaloarchaea archaeon]